MIHHLSIAARDPKHVAAVLAEIMGGKAVPFPPNPGSDLCLADDVAEAEDHESGSKTNLASPPPPPPPPKKKKKRGP